MVTSTVSFTNLLIDRLAREGKDEEPWALLVMAAAEGPEALAAYLNDGVAPTSAPRKIRAAKVAAAAPKAYVRSITVNGFRGVGRAHTLELAAGPGLTVVVGRNGSGKSSYAEALEVLLTGTSFRWKDKGSQIWKSGWRNLHDGANPRVEAVFDVEGEGLVTLRRRWVDAQEVDDGATEVLATGKAVRSLDDLGWARKVEDYRPFMSYSELGSMLVDGPSKLYNALLQGLGLDQFEDVRKRLAEAHAVRKKTRQQARQEAKTLREAMSARQGSDPRAAIAALRLNGRTWDFDELETLATGTASADDTERALLERLSRLVGPDVSDLDSVAAALEAAAARLLALRHVQAGRRALLAELLEKAVGYIEGTGSTGPGGVAGPCPVCGSPHVIDDEWLRHTKAETQRLRAESREIEQVEREVGIARQQLHLLCTEPPREVLDGRAQSWPSVPALAAAWRRLAACRQESRVEALVAGGVAAAREVSSLVATVSQWAREAHAKQADVWQPLALSLASWVASARAAERGAEHLDALDRAQAWMVGTIKTLRGERFSSIQAQALANWELIRMQSNVSLASIDLEGIGRTRRVDVQVSVDGQEASALAVMSQGELNALALSLFLPRACLPDSPFGFIVVDDPVQAMDAARVEGLARMLEAAAAQRQVVVLTHDERLSDVIKQLGIEATMLEVRRGERSMVELRRFRESVDAYLDDARAFVRTENVPVGVAERVVPGLCRMAIEAACIEVTRRRRLGRGESRESVEALLGAKRNLVPLLSLALADDPERTGEMWTRLRNKLGPQATDIVKACQGGAHGEFAGDLKALVSETGSLTGRLRELT